jgi:hypothetical protein
MKSHQLCDYEQFHDVSASYFSCSRVTNISHLEMPMFNYLDVMVQNLHSTLYLIQSHSLFIECVRRWIVVNILIWRQSTTIPKHVILHHTKSGPMAQEEKLYIFYWTTWKYRAEIFTLHLCCYINFKENVQKDLVLMWR